MQKKRSVGVTVCGWYFILQGWIALGHMKEIGYFALVFVALFLCIGIGLLKLLNAARIGAILSFAGLSAYSLFLTIRLSAEYSIFQYPESMVTGKVLSFFIVSTIFFLIFLFFFTRPKVKEQFK